MTVWTMGWTKSPFKDFGDQVLLVVLALAVCIFGLASFWIADEHHINEAWVFVGWNSIWLAPLIIKKYREQLKKPGFVLFSIGWMVIHGLVMVALMRWVPLTLWLILILIELVAGGLAANWLFGVMPSDDNVDQWRLTWRKKTEKKSQANGER